MSLNWVDSFPWLKPPCPSPQSMLLRSWAHILWAKIRHNGFSGHASSGLWPSSPKGPPRPVKVLANGLTFLKLTSSTPSYSPPFWFYPCQFQRQYWWHRRPAFRRDRSAWKLACVAWRLVQDTSDTRDHGRPLAIAFSFACLSYHVFRFVSAKSRCEEVIWAWKSFQFQRPFDIKIKAKKLRPK